jgi:Fimbrillin-A associated anchor proteins Mfa1 and Mfa2
MRKVLLLSAVAAMFLFSCKKEHNAPVKPGPKMYKVTFNMASQFTQTTNALKIAKQHTNSLVLDTATTNIAAYASVIQLGIFDSGGNLIRKVVQNAADVSNFGVIVDSLATGTYTVIAVAGQTGVTLAFNNPVEEKEAVYYTNPGGQFLPWSDTFYDKFQLTITNGPANQNVALTRIVGKLEVDFNDVIPANASRLDIELNKEDFLYFTATGLPGQADTLTYHLTVPDSVKGTSNYKVSELVLNTATPFSVIITAYDASNTVIATHTVTNVTCTKNQRTILTGNFSNAPTNTGTNFNVTVNPSWSAPNIIHY